MLHYTEHIKQVKTKLGLTTKMLYPILNRSCRLTRDNKIRTIKAILVATATYAGEMWAQAAEAQKQQVQAKINKMTRMALGTLWYMSNERIRKEANMETLQEMIERQTLRNIERMKTHDNPEIRKTLKPQRRVIMREGINQLKGQATEHGTTTNKRTRYK